MFPDGLGKGVVRKSFSGTADPTTFPDRLAVFFPRTLEREEDGQDERAVAREPII